MSSSELSRTSAVLDEAQLRRIQATHRGFLYQHLYASGCILVAQRAGFRETVIERDEDIEIHTNEGRTYIQVKTRSGSLIPSDIEPAVQRFDKIRPLHSAPNAENSTTTSGRRTGVASFVIVANVPPGPKLAQVIASESWPSDVRIIWPGTKVGVKDIPPAWPDLEAAFVWCAAAAEKVPFTRVVPETLVWKLAALVQAAAAGGVGTGRCPHSFRTHDLPVLFEQVVRSLQEMPAPPDPYWPHQDDPIPVRDVPVRLITGPTGSGKTAWAFIAAANDSRPYAYFSAYGAEGGGFVPALVRELAARFSGDSPRDLSSILMPGESGLDALRALSLLLREQAVDPVVVVDDLQVLEPEVVLRAIGVAPDLRWVLLGQPGPTMDQISARLALELETLDGWSLATIAAVLDFAGRPADALTCERVRSLTGGLPLFVQNLATIARKTGTDIATLSDQLERGDHLERTAQEVLLANALAELDDEERRLAEILGGCGISLSAEELTDLAETGDVPTMSMGRALRTLIAWGVARRQTEGQVRIHDAFRVLCNGTSGFIDVQTSLALKKRLVERLAADMPTVSVERAGRFLELLPEVGATEQLIEIVGSGSEQLHELGLAPRLKSVLTRVAADSTTDAGARFWALDALAFWAIQENRGGEAAELVEAMSSIAEVSELKQRQTMALLLKTLLLAGIHGDAAGAQKTYEEIAQSTDEQDLLRVARYDYAIVLFMAQKFSRAADIAWDLGLEYYNVVGLDPRWVFRRNPPEIAAKLSESIHDLDDLKRLADCLDLYARARREQGLEYGLARIHAMKFYTVSGSYRSAVKTGQNVVDDMLDMGDLREARTFMEETLIRSVKDLRLTEYLVPVQAQHAVILAYDGDLDGARAELARLRSFRATSPDAQAELENQANLIEAIAAGEVERPRRRHLVSAPTTLPLQPITGSPKVGRNDPCPCGSGRKYKKCCGR